jgi:hypothetical protein
MLRSLSGRNIVIFCAVVHGYAEMWKAQRQPIRDRWGETIVLSTDGAAPKVGAVIASWRDDAIFREAFIAALAATSYPAFFWEMPPVHAGTLSDPFECVVIRSDALTATRADDTDFAGHLNGADLVAAFPNLGGDALLIAPKKLSAADCYGHIAAFVRAAPAAQCHALFQILAQKVQERLAASRERFWISTSGLGVPWVHVRLDSYPKYYQYRPYADR